MKLFKNINQFYIFFLLKKINTNNKQNLFLIWCLFLTHGAFAQILVDSRDKPDGSWKSYLVEQFSNNANYTTKKTILNKYGSNTAYRTTATGFFRTEQIKGRWFIIDPDGYAFIYKGIVHVDPGTSIKQKAAFAEKWGTNDVWLTHVTDWMRTNGFNGVGWSDIELLSKHTNPVVHTVIVRPMFLYRNYHRNYHRNLVGGYSNAGWQGYENNIIRVFDPMFESYMDKTCKNLAQYKNDKYLLGYYIDNELPWVNDALDRHLLLLNETDPCYIAAKNWFDQRKGVNSSPENISQEDRNAFWDFYAGKYFQMAKQYIEKYDPNHMFLGSRFNQAKEELTNPYIFEVAGKYCDIISINHYREWEPIVSRMKNWEEWAKKPFIITEFYTKGEDSGLLNVTGAGWIVRTQRDRGLFYENFVLKLLRSKGCVGWDWFRYQDNDPENLQTDPSNRDSNKGLVDNNYNQYDELMDFCKRTNDNVYSFLDYLKTIETKEQLLLTATKDTYIRLMSTDTDNHGKEKVFNVKNDNGSMYEQRAFVQFDFTPYLNQIKKIEHIRLSLNIVGISPTLNDPKSVIMNVSRISDFSLDEEKDNTQLLKSYSGRNEVFICNTIVPVNKHSSNFPIEVDITSLLPFLVKQPIVTFQLQMNMPTETQFKFASKENTDTSVRPIIKIQMK